MLYDPYGNTISSTLPITLTDRLYTGQRSEPDLGLYDYKARFYDPYLGRFVSPDTMVPDPVNPQQFNRYAYGYNNPVRYYDSDGHCFPFCFIHPLVSAYGIATAASPNELTTNSRAVAEANIPIASSIAEHDVIATEEVWQAYHGVDTAGNALSGDQRSWLAQDAAGHAFQATMEMAATALAIGEFAAVANSTVNYYRPTSTIQSGTAEVKFFQTEEGPHFSINVQNGVQSLVGSQWTFDE